MPGKVIALIVLGWGAALCPALAGGNPLRTLVVVNADSDRSMEAGRFYAEQRGIPDRNLCVITTTNRISITTPAYSNEIEGPVRAYLSAPGLSNQIDAVVFSMDIPHRVYQEPAVDLRWSGLTATFFNGFHTSPSAFAFGCQLAAGSRHDYFESETAFARDGAPSSNRYYLSAMLTASNLANALSLVRRSVRADHTSPYGRVFLMRTSDSDRSVQWQEFADTLFLSRFISAAQERYWLDLDSFSGQTNLFGVTAGRRSHSWFTLNNTIIPGAFGEHLTSFGGYLFEPRPDTAQMSILDWIYYGFSGSYGTVVEPCAYTNKFPSPRIHYWYARGFSLGESLWMSVQHPYQGIFVGDPLCAPFAVTSSVSWLGLTNGAVVSGALSVTGRAVAADASRWVDRVVWYRNGMEQGTATNLAPRSGNEITVSINGTSRTYTVGSGESIATVAAGVAARLNQNPPLGITARAYGDRVVIRRNTLGVDSSSWTIGATSAPGAAAEGLVFATTPFTNFLQTAAEATEGLSLSGNSVSGDVVRVEITRLDGQVFTNQVLVTATSVAPVTILGQLAAAVNADTNLQSAIGCLAKYARVTGGAGNEAEAWLFARTNTWEGHNLFVNYQVITQAGSTLSGPDFSDTFDDNAGVLGARATVFIGAGATQILPVVSLATTNWPDGPHTLTLVAREGTGVGTETRAEVNLLVDNHDLECAITTPLDGGYRLKSGSLTAAVAASVSAGTVTQVALFAEGKLVATASATNLAAAIALSGYGAGPLNLQAQAWATGGRSTLSGIVRVQLYTDTDADGVSDQWEYEHFGTITNFAGTADPDGDGMDNVNEFAADTQPTNGASFLGLKWIEEGALIQFSPGRPERRYQVRITDEEPKFGIWYTAGEAFGGTGLVSWVESATNAPPATNDLRLYGIVPLLPEP